MIRTTFIGAIFLALFSIATSVQAKPLTAFEAEQIAVKHVPTESQNRLILIRGDRSANTLTPDTWHFVYYDELASQNGRQITITGNTLSGIREGYFDLGNLRLAAYKLEEVVDPAKLKIDSDKALGILTDTNLLKPYSLSSIVYDLARDKDLREPVWTLTVYVDDGNGDENKIGYARISAFDGKILEMKFKPFVPKNSDKK